MRYLDFPYRFDGRRRTAETDLPRHVRNLVELILFTMPGERVNRPDFGSALRQLVFAPARQELAATTQLLVQGALTQWLATLVEVEAVTVDSRDESLIVTVAYTLRASGERRTDTFERGLT